MLSRVLLSPFLGELEGALFLFYERVIVLVGLFKVVSDSLQATCAAKY
jgi:hypothetical protein